MTHRSNSPSLPGASEVAYTGNDAALAHWAAAYIESTSLAFKLAPPALPEAPKTTFPTLPARPGRPPELRVSWAKYKAPRSPHALLNPVKRAHLLHTFFHHELQAAELLCWAVVRFPDTPWAFRKGLIHICLDEVRHMNAYAARLLELGYALGAFDVRDWFWERAPSAATPAAFIALMGLGFEAGNLDHARRFADMLRSAGDEASAVLQERVGEEEVAHVAFGAHWFRAFVGELSFEAWLAALPAPLSPMVMRGNPLDDTRRMRAGFDATFLESLRTWQPESRGSST